MTSRRFPVIDGVLTGDCELWPFQTLGGSFSLQCACVVMYCLAAGPMNSDAWAGNETFNIGSHYQPVLQS